MRGWMLAGVLLLAGCATTPPAPTVSLDKAVSELASILNQARTAQMQQGGANPLLLCQATVVLTLSDSTTADKQLGLGGDGKTPLGLFGMTFSSSDTKTAARDQSNTVTLLFNAPGCAAGAPAKAGTAPAGG